MPRPRRAAGLAVLVLWAGAALAEPVLIAESDRSFSEPHDLVVSADGKHLYVADVGNDVIKVLDPKTLETIGTLGAGELSAPHDVAIDADGTLIVADSGNDRIVALSPDGGDVVQLAGWRDGLGSPEGAAVASGGWIYLANASQHTVMLMWAGTVIGRAGGYGDGPNQYIRPHDVEVGPGGRVYVADPGNHRIQVLSPQLSPLETIGGSPYDFNEPKYIALDTRGWLYVADEYNDRIVVMDERRRIVETFGAGMLDRPEGIEVIGNFIWVADTHNDRILLFRR